MCVYFFKHALFFFFEDDTCPHKYRDRFQLCPQKRGVVFRSEKQKDIIAGTDPRRNVSEPPF